jgi:hypothetical protein
MQGLHPVAPVHQRYQYCQHWSDGVDEAQQAEPGGS